MTEGVRYNYYVQLVANQARLDARSEYGSLAVLATGGVEAGRKHSCIDS